MNQPSETILGMFAKYWQAGFVKTRLAVDLDAGKASRLYYEFLRHLTTDLATVGNRRYLVYTPPNRLPEFEALAGDRWSLSPQTEGDLGERMKVFFSSSFQSEIVPISSAADSKSFPSKSVVLIGSDTPQIGVSIIQAAFEVLESQSVVIGPSEDGGYYLIGMNQPILDIFQGITWSSSQVLRQTIDILEKNGTSYGMLPEMFDIDTIRELDRLLNHLPETGVSTNVSLAISLRRILEYESRE